VVRKILIEPGYPYTDSGHFQPCDHGYSQSSPGRAEAEHPTFARLTSAQSVAEQTRPTVVAFVSVTDRRAPTDSTRQTMCTFMVHTTPENGHDRRNPR
jgi:hypothetical protein